MNMHSISLVFLSIGKTLLCSRRSGRKCCIILSTQVHYKNRLAQMIVATYREGSLNVINMLNEYSFTIFLQIRHHGIKLISVVKNILRL
jgi:hypothetical protein